MTVAQRQQTVVDHFAIIENPHERLGAVVDAARSLAPFPDTDRTADLLVPGCTSRVWLRGEVRTDGCHFTADCDSPMVKGLVHLLCQCCEACAPADVAAAPLDVVEQLGLWRDLSPTRQNGLRAVAHRISALARSWIA